MGNEDFDLDHGNLDGEKGEGPRTPVEYDEIAEARVRHKLDWNLMPLFFVLC